MRILRHTLQFEAQYLEIVHHPWHTIGHHTKVFSTHKHARCLHKLRQFLHGLTIPELVIATIIVVIIYAVEDCLIAVIECFIREVELRTDAWVELIRVFTVAHEEHIADQGIKTVAQPDIGI